MKHFLIFTVFLFLIHKQTIAQQPTGWHWVKNNSTSANAITTDVYGNVYLTGDYGDTISFGTTTLSNSAGSGMYLVKYDALGNVLWAKTQTGAGGATGMGVSTDINGNVYVTGSYHYASITFGTYTLTGSTALFANFFIVKFDANGNVLWAKSAAGTGLDGGYRVSSDSNGNAFVTGYFRSASFVIGTHTLINQTSGAGSNVFIAKYDPVGNVLWAKAAVGTNTKLSAYGNSVSADADGNAVITGYFRASSIIFGTYTLTDAGGIQLFVAKYAPNGNVLWAKATGGSGGDIGSAVSTDVNGNIF
ncbi:MAG: SBBP repeat-containing protein [Bacteroidetes bacterium]|nr:SBBP repeat-containing protein [Bacteroidota bacterium]